MSALTGGSALSAMATASTMPTTTKLSFRARNLDATKSMPVYIADELPDLAECAPINRAVTQMPTGMEKDEEMESHLQEAILAQQASTSGIAVENHVIPTPKVFHVSKQDYDSIYPIQPAPSANQLIKVQASLSLGNELPDYDMDSEDEQWLAERGGHISCHDFEKTMELLESASSDLQICQPNEARILLNAFDDDLVDDVYDYWLQKRKDAAALRKVASLIPRVKSDSRRDAGSVNPYIAFRRRAEKMQTRKNRKNDEDSYEKILKLSNDLSRAVLLFEMMRRRKENRKRSTFSSATCREHSKLALIELDIKLLSSRWDVNDFDGSTFNEAVAKAKDDINVSACALDESQDEITGSMSPSKTKKRRRHMRNSSVSEFDKNLVCRAWLKKNAEVWNKPATASNVLSLGCSPVATSSEARRNAESATDGRYTFKRRRGCMYRASLQAKAQNAARDDPHSHFYRTLLPSSSGTSHRCIGFARRRMGRGGRIIFDRVLFSEPGTSQDISDPLFTPIIDTNKTYQAKLAYNEDDQDSLSSLDGEHIRDKDDELDYLRREEFYAKKIYGLSSDEFNRQRLSAGADAVEKDDIQQHTIPVSCYSGKIVGPVETNRSVNGISSAVNVRELVVPANGTTLNYHPDHLSSIRGQRFVQQIPALATVSSGMSPASISNQAFYQQKGTSYIRLATPAGADGSGSVYYTSIPASASLPHGISVVDGAGGTSVKSEAKSGMAPVTSLNSQQPLRSQIVYDNSQRLQNLRHLQQLVRGRGQQRNRTNGRRSRGSCPTVAQLASSIVAEANSQRLGLSGKLPNGEQFPQMGNSVDTKRLELAIAGCGGRLKASGLIHAVPEEPSPNTTLKDLLRPNSKSAYSTVPQTTQHLSSAGGGSIQHNNTRSNVNAPFYISAPVPTSVSVPVLVPGPMASVSSDIHRTGAKILPAQLTSSDICHVVVTDPQVVTASSSVARAPTINGNIVDSRAGVVNQGNGPESVVNSGSNTSISVSTRDACPAYSVMLQNSNDVVPLRAVAVSKNFNERGNPSSGANTSMPSVAGTACVVNMNIAPDNSLKGSDNVASVYDVARNGVISYVTN